jgi:L-ribulose-5-phosphate 3-epimerase
MTHTVSFMSANYVARTLGYAMTRGWGQGDRATNDHFRPLETFAERFEEILRDVRALGFSAIDLWTAHLNPLWASDAHIVIARDLLKKHELEVASLAGPFGDTPEEFEKSCKLAVAMGTGVLGGSTGVQDRALVVEALKNHGLKLGLENHPERTPQEMLDRIGDGGDGTVGTAIDTGWYATQGFDAARAIKELAGHIVHVHLKDVLGVGAHETCRYGRGIVPIEACVRALQEIGYTGAISVEHEPETYDPSEDCKANLAMLQGWLRA